MEENKITLEEAKKYFSAKLAEYVIEEAKKSQTGGTLIWKIQNNKVELRNEYVFNEQDIGWKKFSEFLDVLNEQGYTLEDIRFLGVNGFYLIMQHPEKEFSSGNYAVKLEFNFAGSDTFTKAEASAMHSFSNKHKEAFLSKFYGEENTKLKVKVDDLKKEIATLKEEIEELKEKYELKENDD